MSKLTITSSILVMLLAKESMIYRVWPDSSRLLHNITDPEVLWDGV